MALKIEMELILLLPLSSCVSLVKPLNPLNLCFFCSKVGGLSPKVVVKNHIR